MRLGNNVRWSCFLFLGLWLLLYWPHSFPSKDLVFILPIFKFCFFFFFFCNNSRSGIHCVSIRVKVQGSRLETWLPVTVSKTRKPQGWWNSREAPLSKLSMGKRQYGGLGTGLEGWMSPAQRIIRGEQVSWLKKKKCVFPHKPPLKLIRNSQRI